MPQWTESDRKILDLESKIDAIYKILETAPTDNFWGPKIRHIRSEVCNIKQTLKMYNQQWEEEE